MYEKTDKFVLKGVNLSIPVGSRVALVGSTGSGKTTIAHLLLGLLSPTSGSLLLDGIELADNEVPSWQNNCALVPQDIRLIILVLKKILHLDAILMQSVMMKYGLLSKPPVWLMW